MATVHFNALDDWAGGPRSYENCIFRSETGDRVKLQKVQASPDGRHFEAEIVLLDEGEDGLGAHGDGATEAERCAIEGVRRRTAQPSQRAQAQSGRRSLAREASAENEASGQRVPVPMSPSQVQGGRRSHAMELDGHQSREEAGVEAESPGQRRSTHPPVAQGELEMKVGDLVAAPEDYLVHVCDCLYVGSASGLAARLFEHCPQANVYDRRRHSDSPNVPGDASVHADRVINLYAQFAPGPPMADGSARPPPECEEHFEGLPRGRWDTAEDRLDWFARCLEELPGKLPAEGPEGRRLSLALPVGLGCAESIGASWPEYHAILKIFARDHPSLHVVLYDEEPQGEAEV